MVFTHKIKRGDLPEDFSNFVRKSKNTLYIFGGSDHYAQLLADQRIVDALKEAEGRGVMIHIAVGPHYQVGKELEEMGRNNRIFFRRLKSEPDYKFAVHDYRHVYLEKNPLPQSSEHVGITMDHTLLVGPKREDYFKNTAARL